MLDEKRIARTHLAPYLRNVDVQWDHVNTFDLPEMDFSAEDRERLALREGDLLVCEGGEVGRTALWDGRLSECYFQKAIHRLRPVTQDDEPRFFRYFMRMAVHSGLFALSTASTIQHLPAEKLRVVRYPSPPRWQQRVIADYLDRETARLDALAAAKERVLGLLVEKRRALITRAVTRGLDPRAPLRDSVIPWLGEIPAHWQIKRLKHVGHAIIGLTFDPADTVTDGRGVLVLRASNVRDQQIVLDDNLFVLMDIPELLRTRAGDILICSRSGSRALIGKNALIDRASAGLTFGAFMTVFRSPVNDYLFYIFNSSLFDYQAGAFSTSTINQLTVETLNGMEVPLPPPPEQEAIVACLRHKTSQLDRVTEATMRTISLLKERRAALIAAAVTGQIDVQEAIA
jgi:type I restriction enzyme S subunit